MNAPPGVACSLQNGVKSWEKLKGWAETIVGENFSEEMYQLVRPAVITALVANFHRERHDGTPESMKANDFETFELVDMRLLLMSIERRVSGNNYLANTEANQALVVAEFARTAWPNKPPQPMPWYAFFCFAYLFCVQITINPHCSTQSPRMYAQLVMGTMGKPIADIEWSCALAPKKVLHAHMHTNT